MGLTRTIILGLGLAAGLAVSVQGAPSSPARPPGIGLRLTIEGPAFVDARGMTLYRGSPLCDGARSSRLRPNDAEGDVAFEVTVRRARSCLEKNPPVLAPANARPVGKWTVLRRKDGVSQWAYDGQPMHTSAKDKAPGDINGGYLVRLGRGPSPVAIAPLTGVPAGIKARETVAGLTLSDHKGRSLYYRLSKGKCDKACARDWRPLIAPVIAGTAGLSADWSIVSGADGVRQWAFKKRPLYTYVHDKAAHGEQIFGDVFGGGWERPVKGWEVAVLKSAPGRPPGVTIQTLPGDTELFSFGLPKTVYADAKGMTLYTVHCTDGGGSDDDEGAGVACDDVGDDPRYWLGFCGGERNCAETWRTLPAAASAKAIDNIWSVMVVNPTHPFKPVAGNRGVRVWTYRGRPVFTYAADTLPGDFYGDDHGFGTTATGQMQARPIPAYAYGPANPPVLALETGSKGSRR